MPDRPMTIPEMCRSLQKAADQGNWEAVMDRAAYIRIEAELALERQRPGRMLDRMLGTEERTHG